MSSRSHDIVLSSQLSGKLRQEDQKIISSLSYIARRRGGERRRREKECKGEKKKREGERKKA